jgi:VanZ family protein
MLAALRFRYVWLLMGWLLVLFIVYESLTPHPVEIQIEQGDKIGHATAYLALMSWFANIYEDTSERVACVLGCIALAVGLEFAQRLTATRTYEVADMAAGAAGVLAGWLLAPPRLPNYLRLAERLVGRASRSDENG